MTDNHPDPSELWYRKSRKNTVIFALMWLGEIFLILMTLKWMLHLSAVVYLLMIPWALFGWMMVARPSWALRTSRALKEKWERDMERLDKWTPPGFP